MTLILGYMLFVDGEPTKTVGNTLEETQRTAISYLDNKAALKIVSYVAPAPSQAWLYDYQLQEWVELA